MRDYGIFETELNRRSGELHNRLEHIKHDLSQCHVTDWADQAQERENDEVLNQLGHQVNRELAEIGTALQRFKDGVYGVCLKCGKDIALERLKVKPEATYCSHCAAHL